MIELVKVSDKRKIIQAEPIVNYRHVDRAILNQKVMDITFWRRNYNIQGMKAKIDKLTELLGEPTFRGWKIGDIKFLNKQYIWCYEVKNLKNSLIVIYESSSGITIEATANCEPYILEILDIIKDKLKINN